MTYTSLEFAVFLPTVFILYWFVVNKNIKAQNLLLVVASYVFYGWWDWRFLGLIVLSSSVDYVLALMIGKSDIQNARKQLLWMSIAVNLGLLGVFKYYNFFADSFGSAFSLLGQQINPSSLNIILPVGISFYTFQTLSYTIDVYKRKLEPTNDIIAFFAYVSFFPQLVAGPIERATNLLPQFFRKREFDYHQAVNGTKQILWGIFKKVVIADNCARLVNDIFASYSSLRGSTLLLGAFLFAFQIYCDFSGYSDIAIGTARLFNFNLMRNFAYPYFSRDIAEFWRRWHISLSTWFRDYLYIPLGGSKGGLWGKVRNTLIIFTVSGFWHGASWTFVLWGLLNALYFLPLLIFKRNRSNLGIVAEGRLLPSFGDIIRIGSTFTLVTLTWVFFRAETVSQAIGYISRIFSPSILSFPEHHGSIATLILITIFVLIEWVGRSDEYAIATLGATFPWVVRWSFYSLILLVIVLYGQALGTPFIYFQF